MLDFLTLQSQQQEDRFAKERLIDRFPVMRESENVELYLLSLENKMRHINFLVDEWKSLITVFLMARLKANIGELQCDPMSSYDDIKTCLLAKAGVSRTKASQKLFNITWESLRGKSTGEILQHINWNVSRIYEKAATEHDRQARLLLVRIRMIVDEDLRLHLDHCAIQTGQDLHNAMESWESSQSWLHRDKPVVTEEFVPPIDHTKIV